jgi:hypothetical protein
MSVLRVEKTQNYTVLSNHHLRNKNLTLKAKGLLSVILSLPDDWDYSIAGLSCICVEGKDAIRAAILELEREGYIARVLARSNGGTFSGYDYIVSEHPKELNQDNAEGVATGVTLTPVQAEYSSTAVPSSENPSSAMPTSANPTQLSTKEVSTNRLNTYKTKYENIGIANAEKPQPHGTYQNVFLSAADLAKLKAEYPLDWESRIERLSEYIETHGKKYKNHLAVIRSWARNDYKRRAATQSFKQPDYSYEEGEVL